MEPSEWKELAFSQVLSTIIKQTNKQIVNNDDDLLSSNEFIFCIERQLNNVSRILQINTPISSTFPVPVISWSIDYLYFQLKG